MSQLRIFVSHSSSDKPFADALVHALRQVGADVWYDEHNLGPGVRRREIMRELADRPVFVFVLSKAALASSWVQDECKWAYNLFRRKPERLILPVVGAAYDPVDLDHLRYLVSMKRVEGPGHQPYPPAEAIERTLRLLALTPAGRAPAPTTLPSESVDDWVAHGKSLRVQEQYAEAIPFFERATVLAPDSFDAWFNLGYMHNALQQWSQALVAWDRTVTIRPNAAIAAYNMNIALNHLKRYEASLAASDLGLASDAYNARAWRIRAISLRALGREAEAQEAERRAKELGE